MVYKVKIKNFLVYRSTVNYNLTEFLMEIHNSFKKNIDLLNPSQNENCIIHNLEVIIKNKISFCITTC